MSLCLASAGVMKSLVLSAFTLAWTHSVEKIEWQEDWRLSGSQLQIVEARVKGSGAGMEPGPDARLMDGWYRWKPQRPPQTELVLGNSGAAGEWRFCTSGGCRTLSDILEMPAAAVTTLSVCAGSTRPSAGKANLQ